ncbi:MAG: TadE/TadG family type IV pilus assembly protein [Acidobacteriaceae bacterium]
MRLRRAFGSDGATLVEFALSASIMFVLLIGIMEICLAFFAYHYVNEAAREASRWAMVRGANSCSNTPGLADCGASGTEIQSFVQNLGYPSIIAGNTTVNTEWCTVSATLPTSWSGCSSGGSNTPGNEVQVTVTYKFPLNIPFISQKTLSIQSTSAMVISQ